MQFKVKNSKFTIAPVLVISILVLFESLAYSKVTSAPAFVRQKSSKKPAGLHQRAIPEKPAIEKHKQNVNVTPFAEVEVLIDENWTLEYLTGLPSAPDGKPKVLDKPRRVVLQLPVEQVKTLINNGANVRTLRNYILVEGEESGDKTYTDTVSPKATGNCYGQNNSMVYIPDYPYGWVYSEIPISCAPAGSIVTSISVHFEIFHTYPSDLIIDLTDADLDNGCEIHLFDREDNGSYDITRDFTGLTVCNGRPVNQSWYLWAYDDAYDDEGYIETWWIRVYYETGGCTPPVHNDCGNAIAVNAGMPYSGTTVCATGTDITSCADNDTADVWHSFTPTTTGLYTISLCGSSFDTTLAVFTECWQGELACNDDSDNCGQGSVQSEIEITLNAGYQYLIRVAGYNGATGNYLLTVTAPEIRPPDGVTTYRAVVCGISDYQFISDLSYCDDDARDVRDALLAAGNWNASNITVLIDSAASKAAIQSAISNMASASDSDDFCLFFFSGHGTTVTDMPPYDETDGLDELLAAYNSYQSATTFISDDEFGNWIAALPTDKYVILLDACHSGGQIKGLNVAGTVKGFGTIVPQKGDGFAADLAPKIGVKDLDDNGRGVVITASNDTELSQESSGLQNGVFTYYLVQGMYGPADDGDAGTCISAEECYNYLYSRALSYNPNQHAQIYDPNTDELDFLGQCGPVYCQPTGACGYEYITDVQVGSISNTGTTCGTNGYTDYTSLSTIMQKGSFYGAIINVANPNAGDQLGVWVDWNQDKDFDDASETMSTVSGPVLGHFTASIPPPAEAILGNTRMRVRVIRSVSPTPCGSYSYSEAEDYTITVTAASTTITISGYIKTYNNTSLSGATVSATTGQSDTTDSSGYYEVVLPKPYSGNITPSKTGWRFYPERRSFISASENQTNVNFTGIQQFETTIITSEDTIVKSAEPSTNFGSINSVNATREGEIKLAYLKFNLVSIPDNSKIVRAQLRLNSNFITWTTPQIGAHYLKSDNWNEMTLTWNTADMNYSPTPAAVTAIQQDENFWLVTKNVSHAYGDDGVYTVVLDANASVGGEAGFWSREFPSSDMRPRLIITYEQSGYGGGRGGLDWPYLIYTPEQMNRIGLDVNDWDKNFKLAADIDLGYYDGLDGRPVFNTIGIMTPSSTTPFTGTFDGDGLSISNFKYLTYKSNGVAIFIDINGPEAQIKNLALINPQIDVQGHVYYAALAARVDRGVIRNCYVEGGTISGDDYVGAIVGDNWGEIYDSGSSCEILGYDYVGGLVGRNMGVIERCCASGNVTGDSPVGGLVGQHSNLFDSPGIVNNCYATGSVSGDYAGGLVGQNLGGSIDYCYSAGAVAGTSNIGGLIGNTALSGTCDNSFWDTENSGQDTSAGGTGKTTDKMKIRKTFIDAGWDFVNETENGTDDIWRISEGADYPRLAWEPEPPYIVFTIDLNSRWMYQNLPGSTDSRITAEFNEPSFYDPLENGAYILYWEIILPDDVTVAPELVSGGGEEDISFTFAAPGCTEPDGLSDSGQTFKARLIITGTDYGNFGIAEKEFGIALLGDVDNNKKVDSDDRSMVNLFWKTKAAGPYTLKDCDMDCNGKVDADDRSMVNLIWKKALPGIQNTVSQPCPLR